PAILLLFALSNVLRVPARLLAFPVIKRWGLKTAVMIGAAASRPSSPPAGRTQGAGGGQFAFLPLHTRPNVILRLPFHTLYRLAGETEKRGRQTAMAYAMTAALAALAPLIGAAAITYTGFQSYFMSAFVLVTLMLFALSRCADIAIPQVSWRKGRKLAFNFG